MTQAPASSIRTSVRLVLLSSEPPAAPKEMAARAPPRISAIALSLFRERNTRGGDLAQERNPAQRGHAAPQRDEAARQSQQA